MRSGVVAAVSLALAACGGSREGDQLAAGNSDLSEARIGAALGPAGQSVEDSIVANDTQIDGLQENSEAGAVDKLQTSGEGERSSGGLTRSPQPVD